MFRTLITLCASIVLLSACGQSQPPAKIAEPQREALDQAKAVGQTLQQAASQQQQDINKQTENKGSEKPAGAGY